jgi:hypothetical protein
MEQTKESLKTIQEKNDYTFLIHLAGLNLEDYVSQFIMNNFTSKNLFINEINDENKIQKQLESIKSIIETNKKDKILFLISGLIINEKQVDLISEILKNNLNIEIEYFNTNTVVKDLTEWMHVNNKIISTKILNNFIENKFKNFMTEEKIEYSSFAANLMMDLGTNNIKSPMFSKAQYLLEVFSEISNYPEVLRQYDKYHIFYSLDIYFNAFLNPKLTLNQIENDFYIIHKDFLKLNLSKEVFEADITYKQKYNFFLYNLFRQVEQNYPRFEVDGKTVVLTYNFNFMFAQQTSHYFLADVKDVDIFLNIMPNGQYLMKTNKEDLNLLEFKKELFNARGYKKAVEGNLRIPKLLESDSEMRDYFSKMVTV